MIVWCGDIMVLVKVTRNRRITIPIEICSKLGIKEGDYVEVSLEENKIVIRKIKRLDELAGSWRNVDIEKIMNVIKERWRNLISSA